MESSLNKRPLLNDTEGSDEEDFIDNNYEENAEIKSNDEGFIDQEDEITTSSSAFAPNDNYNFSYLIFYLLGIATLLPWNFFLTSEEYWMFKFRNISDNSTNDNNLTPLQKSFTSDLTIGASVAGTVFLIINAVYSYAVSLKIRMIGSMLGILLLFIVNTSFVEVNTDSWQQTFFIITMVIVILINCCAAILTGGLFGLAGLFPSEYMTAVVSGQALGGIFSSLALIVTLTFGTTETLTAFIYYSIGCFVMLISIIGYVTMSRSEYFRFYVYNNTKNDIKEGNLSQSQEVLTDELRGELVPYFPIVFKKIYIYAVTECLVFCFTLSAYPAVTVLVQSQYHGNGHPWNDLYFTPVVNYLTFNAGDYLGRIIAGLVEWPKNRPHLILLMTIMRIFFVPILMMSNEITHSFLPIVVHSDLAFILIMIGFAISNGYFANICLIMAPKVVMHHEKEMASSIMAAFLSVGLMLGSGISSVLVQLL